MEVVEMVNDGVECQRRTIGTTADKAEGVVALPQSASRLRSAAL